MTKKVDPFVSLGKFIKGRDPMVSTGDRKKYEIHIFNMLKKYSSVSREVLVYKTLFYKNPFFQIELCFQ
ncbi:MAG: hypothetical protein A9957_02220 [Methanohalophilus sp. DAL1]|jgi:hypothetical protein|nr:MAG: hypothetical protein A9957_02220 [Methanohalophilus sp. DAL1]